MKDPNSQYQIDYVLLFILFAIGIVSCCAIASAQASLPPFLQNVNFVLKANPMVFHWIYSHWCYYDYRLRSLSKIAWYLYSFAMVLLIGLELQVPGAVTIKGATAWYRLPGIGNFQPSEIMKLF